MVSTKTVTNLENWNSFKDFSPLNLIFKAYTFKSCNLDLKNPEKISIKQSQDFNIWETEITSESILKGK